jgi:TPP-dependent pyruvate/acetoin dehydrogenase alpha subunit
MTAESAGAEPVGVTRFWSATPDLEDDKATAVALFRSMAFARRFEETTQSLFLRGAIYGSTHLATGQEAVAIGVCSVIQPQDRVAATYRGHTATLGLGVSPVGLLAEMMGKENGIAAGRSGSMNIMSLDHGLIGCFGIVGGSIAAATGVAFAMKYQGGDGVAVAFFGDGAANQGYFQECLNFASIQQLPTVFICENNQYMEFTPTGAVTAGGILPRVTALGIPAEEVDGQDVWAVREAAGRAIASARAGHGPQFIEAQTYRYSDHARGDPINYRPDGEMEAWKARDPLLIARSRLMSMYGMAETEITAVVESANAQVAAVRAKATAAAFPVAGDFGSEFRATAVATDA